ncbi:MAG TPA: hypothetical protein P5032_19075 [Candidatus Competibacter sp.]|nr:hypothetical protein [Candidatus Competibacter sp.]
MNFADHIGKPIQLLYYAPYHSKYNPVARCLGILEQHGNGAKLMDVQTMLEWAKSMTWKGFHPVIELSHQVYVKREIPFPRYLPLQRAYATRRGTADSESAFTQMGHPDSTCFYGMTFLGNYRCANSVAQACGSSRHPPSR